MFSYEYCEILRNIYFEEHLWSGAFNYGNLADLLYLVEESTTLGRLNLSFWVKARTDILSRTILRGPVISIIIDALFIIESKSSMNANKYQVIGIRS